MMNECRVFVVSFESSGLSIPIRGRVSAHHKSQLYYRHELLNESHGDLLELRRHDASQRTKTNEPATTA
jgi:hypothetical protein